jgi:hypothetical protein
VIGRRVRALPLVSSCATGRRYTCALLRDARLAVIPPTGVTTPAAGTTAHLLIAGADDQCVEPALSVEAGDAHYLAASPWS